MMITRVYRVRIKPKYREEFEPLFQTVARASVARFSGCSQVIVGGPTPLSPDEYAMISVWDDEDELNRFAGPDWSQTHIPPGMEKFVDECWVHHFSEL